mmetsp:Transcript_99144/g.319663  ORF Transcript_99144/g.319663 Transcript_99144/m.319663 type:complete len:231 (-) Transcript_99144:1659-2351(-)
MMLVESDERHGHSRVMRTIVSRCCQQMHRFKVELRAKILLGAKVPGPGCGHGVWNRAGMMRLAGAQARALTPPKSTAPMPGWGKASLAKVSRVRCHVKPRAWSGAASRAVAQVGRSALHGVVSQKDHGHTLTARLLVPVRVTWKMEPPVRQSVPPWLRAPAPHGTTRSPGRRRSSACCSSASGRPMLQISALTARKSEQLASSSRGVGSACRRQRGRGGQQQADRARRRG